MRLQVGAMIDRTANERQRRKAARDRTRGLYRITVMVPLNRVLQLRELVQRWREEFLLAEQRAEATRPDVEDT